MKFSKILTFGGIGLGLYALFRVLKSKQTTSETGGGGENYSSVTPANPYGITGTNTAAENLAAANAYISSNGNKNIKSANTYQAQVSKAAATGRASITSLAGKEVVIGPTGNIYQQTEGNKYSYTAGPNTANLGAALIKTETASQKEIKANIQKALTGPKISAKGKYTAVKSKK